MNPVHTSALYSQFTDMFHQVISRPPTLSIADTDATYLIAGGLGGIGRVIALWLVEKGAKNILLVSRDAKSHPNAKELVETAESDDCNLQIQNCDVSSESSLLKLMAGRSAASQPPIKGVINCMMVRDVSYHNPCGILPTPLAATLLTARFPNLGHNLRTHELRTMAAWSASHSLD